MSELGVFAVDRGVFDHPLFNEGQPFSRREAWLWLLAEASWKSRRVAVSGLMIDLDRGELCHSIRFMAKAWGWQKSTVARFLDRLEREKMVCSKTGTPNGTASGTPPGVLSICNYAAYQRVSLPTGTPNGTASGTGAGHQRDRLEDIQGIQEEVGAKAPLSEPAVSDPAPARKRTKYPDDFDAAWLAYPRTPNMSKAEALTAWKKLPADDRALVLPSIPAYVGFLKTKPDLEVIHFCRYLSKRRFEGYASAPAAEADWRKRLMFARNCATWSTVEWGPMPGQPGSRVPADLLVDTDGAGWADKDAGAVARFGMKPNDPDWQHYRGAI